MVTPDVDIAQRLLADLRERLEAPDLAYAEPPERILAGAENWIFSLRLSGGPVSLAGPLILRRYPPDRATAGIRCEAVIQQALLEQGYPAPRVALFCEDAAPLGGAYLLMNRIPGRVLLGEIAHLPEVFGNVGSALRAVPRMVYEGGFRVPRELARWMLRLHALDTHRLIEALEGAGFALRDYTMEGRLERIERRVAEARLDGLAPALAWLRERYEKPSERVLCHADFHFLNLLVEGSQLSGVVDWSGEHFCFEDPAYDVGNTRALFDITVPGLPSLLRGGFEAVQRRLRDGFTRRYERERPVDPERVRWAEVFRYVREMTHAGESLRRGESATLDFLSEGGNPWIIPEIQASVLAGIESRTGVPVSLPEAS